MAGVRRFLQRLLALLRPHRADRGMDRELAAHLRLIEDEYRRQGLPPAAAARAARLALGGVDQTREVHRDARSFRWLDDARRDVSYAIRMLRRRPAVTTAAVLSLALGIGLNAAVFSVVDWVLLRSLPYPDAHQLVSVTGNRPPPATESWSFTPAEVEEVARGASFRAVAGFSVSGNDIVTGAGIDPAHVTVTRMTGDLFGILGVHAALGRLITPEDVMARAPVVVLSHRAWQDLAGGDPAVIGRTVAIEQVVFVVVGVMPPHQGYPAETDFWRPIGTGEALDRELKVLARLRSETTIDQASAELATMASATSNGARRLWAESVQHTSVKNIQTALTALIAATTLVLVIAVANVASLVGARSADRAGEIALRGALGAGRARLLTQLLTEAIVLAFVGGTFGLLIGRWTLDGLIALAPAGIPRLREITLDLRVVAAGLSVTLAAGIVSGLVPAMQASRASATDALQRTGWGRAPRPSVGRRVLVVAQITLAVVLTTGAGLFARSLAIQVQVDNGFDPDPLVAVRLDLKDSSAFASTLPDLAVLAQSVAGVHDAAVAMRLPTQPGGLGVRVQDVLDPGGGVKQATLRPVSGTYFRVTGVPLVAGRVFTEADTRTAPLVAIINTRLSRDLFGSGPAVGQRVMSNRATGPLTIVGVVGEMTPAGEADRAAFYVPVGQLAYASGYLIVRTAGPAATLIPAIRERLRPRVPDLALDRIFRVAETLEDQRAATRFNTQLASTFAGLALLLAAVGIYGLAAADVSARWRELAVRMALGASRRGALWAVMRPCVIVAATGAVIGVAGGLAVGPSLASLLQGVGPSDPFTIITAPVVLAVVALSAALLASVRVLSANPAVALRAD